MWRFLHVSDPHLGSMTDTGWNNHVICGLMPEVIGCLKRDIQENPPDFMLVTGDLSIEPSRDSIFAARDLLDSFGVPYYPSGGDLDFRLPESRNWFLDAFDASLPGLATYYSFTHKGLHFCVLDPWWLWADGSLCPFRPDEGPDAWAIPPHEFDWLQKDLEANRETPTVVVVHQPALPIPERLRRDGMKNAGCLANGALLTDLLAHHVQVKVLFSGHVHMNYIVKDRGLTHIVSCALSEYPIEYRIIEVTDTRLTVQTQALSDPVYAEHSLVEGNEWTAGEDRDRDIVIEL